PHLSGPPVAGQEANLQRVTPLTQTLVVRCDEIHGSPPEHELWAHLTPLDLTPGREPRRTELCRRALAPEPQNLQRPQVEEPQRHRAVLPQILTPLTRHP